MPSKQVKKKWFLGALEFFGALIPGASILYVLRFIAVSAELIENTQWPDTTIDWAVFLVVSFILGYLAHPPAHILNKLYDCTYRRWRRKGGDPLFDYAQRKAKPYVGPNDSVYAWAKSEVLAFSTEQGARIDLIEGISKMFRTLSFMAIVAAMLSLYAKAWLILTGLVTTALLSFLVFCERRFAATKEVYQGLRRAKEEPANGPHIIVP
jgi:hypothetical protein